ncbi:MAG: hypothetical protein L6Q73_14900 [Aquabacterium sp.]|nr:hypothetical protein [Aquabacterium sp.]
MSVQRIRAALHGVQACILEHKTTRAKYRLPRAFGHDAVRIHKAFGLKRNLDVKVDRSEARRNPRHHTTGTHSGASGNEVRSAQHAEVVDSK